MGASPSSPAGRPLSSPSDNAATGGPATAGENHRPPMVMRPPRNPHAGIAIRDPDGGMLVGPPPAGLGASSGAGRRLRTDGPIGGPGN
jgi:hypothetical protein